MRVLVLSQQFHPEPSRISQAVAEEMHRHGHQVRILTGFPNYPSGRLAHGYSIRPRIDMRERSFRVRRVALYPSHDQSTLRRTVNYLSFALSSSVMGWDLLRSADVVYVYGSPTTATLGAVLARRLAGTPFVFHLQDLWPESVTHSGFFRSQLTRQVVDTCIGRYCQAVYGAAEHIVALGPTMREILLDRGVPPDKVTSVLNWGDEDRGEPPTDPGPGRDELGLSADDFVVMYAGNLGPFQGLDVAIRAAAELGEHLEGLRLVLVGSGTEEQRLRALARDLGADNVWFAGRRPMSTMPRLYAAADVQLVCLRDLAFFRGTIPGKFQQVLMNGQPMICAIAGDAKELIEEAGAGWTATPGDSADLAAALERAHDSRERLPVMGKAARTLYEQRMQREKGLARIRRILLAAAGRSS